MNKKVKEEFVESKIQENYEEKNNTLSLGKKILYSFYSTLVFFFITSPVMNQFLQYIFINRLALFDDKGCPNNTLLLLNTFVFFVIIFMIMILSS